ncbi:unnamed protein product [Onchocerca ochengi]|uniref:Ropporin-1-like protein n=1 Tax=Onchocerca ochengi TaxID=42157 RepID=A0A182EWC7_ONCOC|nr:unnamed protein product [Onchocerca ochengi]
MKHTEAEKLFLEKMAVLNKTFLYFIQCSLKEMPDADLSPCVRDYLKHVEELDQTYGNIGFVSNGSSTTTSTDNGKKGEVINELLESSPSQKDGSGIIVKSSAAQEKPISNEINIFNSTTNPASVPKLSFDISTSSAGSGERIVFIFS